MFNFKPWQLHPHFTKQFKDYKVISLSSIITKNCTLASIKPRAFEIMNNW